jgi:membrane protein DedA with SNARE-associated domain
MASEGYRHADGSPGEAPTRWGMGLLTIFLGFLVAGVVADYVVENDVLAAPNQSITLLGTTVTASGVAVVVGAFMAGALAAVLIVIGVGFLRGSWGRRRALKKRIAELEWQNTELRARENLGAVVHAEHARHITTLPESEEIELTSQ